MHRRGDISKARSAAPLSAIRSGDFGGNLNELTAFLKTKMAGKADAAEKELIPGAAPAAVKSDAKTPIKIAPGGTTIEASAFSSMLAVRVLNAHSGGGRQVNFDKSLPSSWVEYTLDVPADGTYALQLKAAAANDGQFFDVIVGADAPINLPIANSHGTWATTVPVELKLQKGTQKLRISAPTQRGVAVRHLELKAKG